MTAIFEQPFPRFGSAWDNYKLLLPSPATERDELAFWAGASVLFMLMIRMLDPEEEPTDADMAKMDRLNEELQRFQRTFDRRIAALHGHRQ